MASVLCWNGLFFLLLLEVVGGNCRGRLAEVESPRVFLTSLAPPMFRNSGGSLGEPKARHLLGHPRPSRAEVEKIGSG